MVVGRSVADLGHGLEVAARVGLGLALAQADAADRRRHWVVHHVTHQPRALPANNTAQALLEAACDSQR